MEYSVERLQDCRTSAKEELRLQLGNLRMDLETLSAQLPKEERKKAKALNKTFLKEVFCFFTTPPPFPSSNLTYLFQ